MFTSLLPPTWKIAWPFSWEVTIGQFVTHNRTVVTSKMNHHMIWLGLQQRCKHFSRICLLLCSVSVVYYRRAIKLIRLIPLMMFNMFTVSKLSSSKSHSYGESFMWFCLILTTGWKTSPLRGASTACSTMHLWQRGGSPGTTLCSQGTGTSDWYISSLACTSFVYTVV